MTGLHAHERRPQSVFQGTCVVVVGGAGFVGSNLVRALSESDAKRVVVIDNLLSADPANVPEAANVEFIEGSITNDALLGALPATRTSSSTSRRSTATRTRWPTRWRTTRTTR